MKSSTLLFNAVVLAAVVAGGSPAGAQQGQNLPDVFPYQMLPIFGRSEPAEDIDARRFQYQVAQNPGLSVVEFELPTCLACNPVSREVNTLVSQHPASDVSYLRLDLNKNLNLSYKYDVPKVPAVLLFVDGRLVRKFSEFKPCLLYTSPSPRDS